jgi:hypothetical protein
MTYLILAFIAVILLLGIALAIAVKVAATRGKLIDEQKATIDEALGLLMKQQAHLVKIQEAQQNADEKKETLHTGDDTADFNNSLGVLHNASKNRGG